MRFQGILNKPGFAFLGGMLIMGLLLGGRWALAAWVDPTDPPPGGNIEPPINTSTVGQIKKGGLGINCGDPCTGSLSKAFEVFDGSGALVASIDSSGNLSVNDLVINGVFSVNNLTVIGFSTLSGGAKIGDANAVTLGLVANNIFTSSNDLILRPNSGAVNGILFQNDFGTKVASIDNRGVLSVQSELATLGSDLKINSSKKPVIIGGQTSIGDTSLNGNFHALSVIAKPNEKYSSLYVSQEGTPTEKTKSYAGWFQGRVQIGGPETTSGNALGIYTTSTANDSAIYVQESGAGYAGSFSGKVKLIENGTNGGLLIGDSVTELKNNQGIQIYTKGQSAITAEVNDDGGNKPDYGLKVSYFGAKSGTAAVQGIVDYAYAIPRYGVYGLGKSSDGSIGVRGESDAGIGVQALTSSTSGDPALYVTSDFQGANTDPNDNDIGIVVAEGDIAINNYEKLKLNGTNGDASIYYDQGAECVKIQVGLNSYNFGKASNTCKPDCTRAGGQCLTNPTQCPLGQKESPKHACERIFDRCCVPTNLPDPF